MIRNETLAFEPDLRAELDAAYERWLSRSLHRTNEGPVEQACREIVEEIDASARFGAVETRVYPWHTSYSTRQYLDLLETYSDHAILAAEPRARLFGEIEAALDRRGGVLEVNYVSLAFVARRR